MALPLAQGLGVHGPRAALRKVMGVEVEGQAAWKQAVYTNDGSHIAQNSRGPVQRHRFIVFRS